MVQNNFLNKYKTSTWDKIWLHMSFWMACPLVVILGQNITFFYMIYLVFNYSSRLKIFTTNHWIASIPVFIVIAAVISVIDINTGSVTKSLIVLPNYIYWQFFILMILSLRYKLDYLLIAKGTFFGVLFFAFFYFFFYSWLKIPGVITRITPNTLAFSIICFAAPAVAYCNLRYGKTAAIFLLIALLVILIMKERRSGFVFTFLTCFAALSLRKMNTRYFLVTLFLAVLTSIIINTELFEDVIFSSSPRIHEVIYETGKVQAEDQSYLTRRLMVEKATLIFEKHPWTGVGLNNFDKYEVEFTGNFVGSEIILHKDFINQISAHNSYATFIGEGGLLLFIPFIILVIFNILLMIKKYNERNMIQNSFYWCYLGAIFSMYFISGVLSINTWFLIGIVTALSITDYKLRNFENSILLSHQRKNRV